MYGKNIGHKFVPNNWITNKVNWGIWSWV